MVVTFFIHGDKRRNKIPNCNVAKNLHYPGVSHRRQRVPPECAEANRRGPVECRPEESHHHHSTPLNHLHVYLFTPAACDKLFDLVKLCQYICMF